MLEGQDGGGGEQRHLPAVLDDFKGGAHREFGFAVTHVAAQQAVHWVRTLQVALDVRDRRQLVGSLLKFKSVFEFFLPWCVGARGDATAHLALGVKLQKLLGHVAQRALDTGLGALPGGSPQSIEWRLRAITARAVSLDQIQALQRHIKFGVFLVRQKHEVARGTLDRKLAKTAVEADPVVHMHDVIADLEVAEVGNEA